MPRYHGWFRPHMNPTFGGIADINGVNSSGLITPMPIPRRTLALSGRGLRTGLWQHPFSAAHSYPALFLQRLQRIGDGSLADLAALRLDLLGNLGDRKGAVRIQDLGDGRANGLARRYGDLFPPGGFQFRSPPRCCLPCRCRLKCYELALGDPKVD